METCIHVDGLGHIVLIAMSLWQGEERDSSDEEWDNAYAAMDPAAQMGWGKRSGHSANAGSSEMVRDVFQAADVVHEEAMEAMDDNNVQQGDESVRNADDVAGETTPMTYEGSVESEGGGFGEMEGVEGENATCDGWCHTALRKSRCYATRMCKPARLITIHVSDS